MVSSWIGEAKAHAAFLPSALLATALLATALCMKERSKRDSSSHLLFRADTTSDAKSFLNCSNLCGASDSHSA